MSKWNKQSINPSEGTAPTQWDDFFPPLEYQQPGVDLLQNLAWPASEALARPTGPSQQAMHTPPRAESTSTVYGRRQGWPKHYVPAHHRPWHSQHPSVINNNRLLETLKDQKSIFSDGGESFDPKSTPWFTHWLVAFAVRQTVLTADEICVLYIYKYRNVIHDADRIEAKHIHAIDQMLCQGEHEYAYEWDREKGCDDAMRDLLNVWLSNACKPKRPETEEEKHMRRLLDLLDSAPDYGVSF